MFRNVLTMAGKELMILWKDRGSLMVLFLLPVVLSSVFGSISSSAGGATEGSDALHIPAFVVNLDQGAYGAQVLNALEGIDALDVEKVADEATAQERVLSGEALAAVILPADLSANVNAYLPSTVRVVVDPAQATYGTIITGILNAVLEPIALQGELRYGIRAVIDAAGAFEGADAEFLAGVESMTLGAIMTRLQEIQQSPWIVVRAETPDGLAAREPANAFSYTVPMLYVMFSFFLMGTIGQSLWIEREQGSLRRLLAGPMRRWQIIAGKILAYMLVICLQAVVLFAIGNLVFHMPLGNSPLGLALLTVSLSLVSTSLGTLIASFSRTSRQADGAGTLLAFILAAIGGCIGYPLYLLEGPVGFISRLTPHAHALMGYTAIMTEGASASDALPQVGILLAMGTVLLVVASRRLRYDP